MTISDYKKSLESYMGTARTPADLKAFWQRKMTEGKRTLTVEPVDFGNKSAVYERWLIAGEGYQVKARCIRPAEDGKHPVVLMFHDLNRGVRGWHHMTRFLALGYGVVALDATADPRDWKEQAPQMDFEERYRDALILADTTLMLPWVDSKRIVTWGEGFGGGLGLVVGAMLPGNVGCAALNPMPTDFRHVCSRLSEEEGARLDYVDISSIASEVGGKVLMGICLMDEIAPPEGQYAIYHGLPCEKALKVYPKYGHERVNFFENEVLNFLHDVKLV